MDSDSEETCEKVVETEKLQIQEENSALLIEIAQLCARPDSDRNKAENIFLFGKPGVGKSAMVNTIIKALCGKYLYKAKSGEGITCLKTTTFERYEQCGIERSELQCSQKDVLSNCLHMLPTIIDAPGFEYLAEGDQENERLDLFLRGFIPPGTSVKFLNDMQRKCGTGCLKTLYNRNHEEWVVTKLVFVTSCTEALPTELIRHLLRFLETYNKRTGLKKYNIDVFVVTTKVDLVQGKITKETTFPRHQIYMEEFKEKQNEIAKLFSIVGSREHNSICWVNYVDDQSEDNPYIDNTALKFMRQMLQSGRRKHETETHHEPVLIRYKEIQLKTMRYINSLYVNVTHALVLFALGTLFCIIQYVLLYPGGHKGIAK